MFFVFLVFISSASAFLAPGSRLYLYLYARAFEFKFGILRVLSVSVLAVSYQQMRVCLVSWLAIVIADVCCWPLFI